MVRNVTRLFLCFSVCLLLALSAGAQEFSGEIVNTHDGKEAGPAKIFVSNSKVRIEPQDARQGHGAVIMDFSTQVMDVLIPQQHMYLESQGGQGPGRQMFNFFRSGDVNNACSEWAKLPNRSNGTCRRIGTDTVNGRDAVKYEGTSQDGKTGYFWLDSKLRFPIKWQEADSSGEVRNIQEGRQPEGLFEIPAGYQKMDMSNMMGHMPQR